MRKPHTTPTKAIVVLALFAFAFALADAHARPSHTSPRRQDAAAKPSQESKEQRVTKEGDVVKAEESCARAESLSKQGDTRGALKAFGESAKLYKRIYLSARQPKLKSAPDERARFREEMAARLRRAPQCLELYARIVGPEGADDFERGQLEALRAHVVGITESGASSIVYFASEIDERIVLTYRPPTHYSRESSLVHFVETVKMRVVLSADGKVKYPLVVAGSESPSLKPTIESALATKFKPAVKDGRAVSQFAMLEFNYSTR